MFVFRDRIAKVTPADVNRVAALYFKQSNRTRRHVPAHEEPRPHHRAAATPAVELAVKDYKGGKGLDLGEAFDPTPDNIEKRVKRLQLASGIKVAILPKKTRGQANVGELDAAFRQ